ncbi:MAG: hypothetical protein GAK29_02194 [Acinetobacter bereziniae]|uniref:DNA-binding protein n=1 Tax=Acinetobacter bereziniae TaxID=106648 RepID=A0A833PE11_ACIBZ|nr:MAG: hypothetical protein GAK29_02194 [Acinetobacter bereziniae]
MSRLTKLDRMSNEEKKALIDDYRNAPTDSDFSPEVLSLVYGFSLPWLQKKRCEGNGIPFFKPTAKIVLYKKQDVIDWVNSQRLSHTA